MLKRFLILLTVPLFFTSCEVLSQLPSTANTGSVTPTEAEAGQGIKEALAQGLSRAVLNLNKSDGLLATSCTKYYFRPMHRK